MEIDDATPGRVEVALYDLQGRQVHTETIAVTAEGRLQFSLDRAGRPVPSGVYFARVRDASGAWSAAVRAVVLR
jgi:hypothetical protein